MPGRRQTIQARVRRGSASKSVKASSSRPLGSVMIRIILLASAALRRHRAPPARGAGHQAAASATLRHPTRSPNRARCRSRRPISEDQGRRLPARASRGMAAAEREVTAIADQTRRRRPSTTRSSRWSARACCSARRTSSSRGHGATPTTRCRRPTPRGADARRARDAIYLNPNCSGASRTIHDNRAAGPGPRAGVLVDVYYKDSCTPARSCRGQEDAAQGDEQGLSTLADRISARSCSPPPRPARSWSTDKAELAGLSRRGDRRRAGSREGPQARRAMSCRCRTRRSSRR